MYVESSWMTTTCEGFHFKRQNWNSSWSWKKQRSQIDLNIETHMVLNMERRNQMHEERMKTFILKRDFRKMRCCIRKGEILLLWTLMIHMATCEAWVSLLGYIERESTSSTGEVHVRWIRHTGMQKRTPKTKKRPKNILRYMNNDWKKKGVHKKGNWGQNIQLKW